MGGTEGGWIVQASKLHESDELHMWNSMHLQAPRIKSAHGNRDSTMTLIVGGI